MDTKKILIQINNVSFKYPSGDYLFSNIKLTVNQGDRTAIVGINGSGKSTLLKILTGKIKVEEGSHSITCSAYYVPQIDLEIHKSTLKTHEYIAQYYEEWWDVLDTAEKLFGLALDLDSEIKTLSGGELMKLNLAIAIQHNPEVLILDEPTNHLDVRSINTLINFIIGDIKRKYTFIIVSHDVYFLDQVVTTIWELDNKQITTYGGNYSFYKEQKALRLRGIKRQLDVVKDNLERANRLEQETIEKQAKKANEAKRAFIKGSIDKTAYSEGKNAASTAQQNKNNTINKLKEEAESKLEEMQTEDRKLAFITMKNTSENAKRTIFEVKGATLKVENKELITNINLKVIYGDRTLIAGDNGSGKTSLLKALVNKNNGIAKLTGEVYIGDKLEWVYIDQQYSLINPHISLLQNLLDYNKTITIDKAKEQLGKFQFKAEHEINKLVTKLSGGEMIRLIMAMITSYPIDLVVLDEPTNNLDVDTVEVLVNALNNFRGAILLISHNVDFISKIKIGTFYIISNNKLKLLNAEPGHKGELFKALS